MPFALSHTLAPTSGTISPKTSGTLLLFLPSKANSRHFSSQNISVKPHCPSLPSVCTVCVCVCVHRLHNYAWTFVDIYTYLFIWITFSFWLYIRCVCLFSAFSRRVGDLQISIIYTLDALKVREKKSPNKYLYHRSYECQEKESPNKQHLKFQWQSGLYFLTTG